MSSRTPPAGRAAALGDLRVVGEGDAVAGGQLEPLGVVALHEALAVGVAQDPALAADGFGHQRAGRFLRRDHPGGVELHELHVAQAAPRVGGQAHRVARVLVAARGGATPDPGVAARGEDHRIGEDHVARPVVDVEPVGAEHPALVDEQPRDVQVVVDLDTELGHALRTRARWISRPV